MEKLETERIEIVPFNLKTGEIVRGRVITPAMEAEIKRKKKLKAEKQRINKKYEQYGNFYWFFYSIKEQLFDGKIDGATATRLIYLATYLNYDNVLVFENKKPMHKKDLQDVLKIKDTAYKDFVKECVKNDLIIINDDDTVAMPKAYFKRGNLTKTNIKKADIIRMYNDSIRYLYDNADPTYHKNLAYLFMVIPYVNVDYNLICTNPDEKDIDKIQCINTQQLCEIVGYNPKNYRRFRQNLKQIIINDSFAVSFVDNIFGEKIFVNPTIYYAGDKHDKVWILDKF